MIEEIFRYTVIIYIILIFIITIVSISSCLCSLSILYDSYLISKSITNNDTISINKLENNQEKE